MNGINGRVDLDYSYQDLPTIIRNGDCVCIEINTAKLVDAINADILGIDWKTVQKIIYGERTIDKVVADLLDRFHEEVQELSKDPDQGQDIISEIIVPILFRRAIGKKLKKASIILQLSCLICLNDWPLFLNMIFGWKKTKPEQFFR